MGDVWVKVADYPSPLAEDVIETVKNSGAGSLADLARMAARDGGQLELTAEEARNSGAGFVQDVLKNVELPVEFSTAVENIQNALNPAVTVDQGDFPQFTTGSTVRFEGTGSAALDGLSFVVVSINTVGKTFKVDADLSAEEAPIRQGTIFLVEAGTDEPVYDPPITTEE